MKKEQTSQASRIRPYHRLSVALDLYPPTNEDRILAWRQRLERHNRALRHGRIASFPLPIVIVKA